MRCKYFCLVKSAVALPNKQAGQVQRVHFLLRVGTLAPWRESDNAYRRFTRLWNELSDKTFIWQGDRRRNSKLRIREVRGEGNQRDMRGETRRQSALNNEDQFIIRFHQNRSLFSSHLDVSQNKHLLTWKILSLLEISDSAIHQSADHKIIQLILHPPGGSICLNVKISEKKQAWDIPAPNNWMLRCNWMSKTCQLGSKWNNNNVKMGKWTHIW